MANENLQTKFTQTFPEGLIDEPLAKYCTLKVGGPADFFCKAKDIETLKNLISFAKENSLPYFLLSGGSNVLFDDKGFRGLTIKIDLKNIEIKDEEITADAGVIVALMMNKALASGLTGFEKWLGLPGTVGGAVRGNAGCNGLETKDILVKATLLNPETGEIHEEKTEYFGFDYRDSKIKHSNEIILNATFRLKKGAPEKIENPRVFTQPKGLSAGSFFKNPSPENPAGALIDKAGLKGTRIGNAQISDVHGNFIINLGGATSKDIKDLVSLAKTTVKEKFNINLEEEVKIVGEK
ncbi:UDP-N-acetylmuramate dehydrogenase [Candidatus Gracilibacteria bacterium]|jgi:UDP-N-acetylmuramate dehydrogenase|nr:UDP-N-acetylmuramate dehydrogenase [Candidatus Gracilibacteria bacterium]